MLDVQHFGGGAPQHDNNPFHFGLIDRPFLVSFKTAVTVCPKLSKLSAEIIVFTSTEPLPTPTVPKRGHKTQLPQVLLVLFNQKWPINSTSSLCQERCVSMSVDRMYKSGSTYAIFLFAC